MLPGPAQEGHPCAGCNLYSLYNNARRSSVASGGCVHGARGGRKRQASQLQAARVRHGTLETLRWRSGSFLRHQPLQMTQP